MRLLDAWRVNKPFDLSVLCWIICNEGEEMVPGKLKRRAVISRAMKLIVCAWAILALFPAQTWAANANLSNWMKNLSEPTVDEQTGLQDKNAEIEINGSTIHVLWITESYGPDCQTIYYRRSVDGGKTWQPKVALLTGADSEGTKIDVSSEYKRMAVLGNTVHIAVNHYGKNSKGEWYGVLTYLRSIDNGASFLPPRTLFNGAVAWHVYDTFVSAADGKVSIGFRHQCNWEIPKNAYHILDSSDKGKTFMQRTAYSTNSGSEWRVWDFKRYRNSMYVLYADRYYYYGLQYSKLYLAASSDNGATFTRKVISVPSANGKHKSGWECQNEHYAPKIGASGSNVYVVWTGLDSADQVQLFLRRSSDNGKTLSKPYILSKGLPDGVHTVSGHETIAAQGDYVYVVFVTEGNGNSDVYCRRSSDGGATFKALQPLATASGPYWLTGGWWPLVQTAPADSSGSQVHVLWNAPTHLFSKNGGATFIKPALLSTHFTSGGTNRPQMAIGKDGSVHWVAERNIYSEGVSGDVDIFYRKLPTPPQPRDKNLGLSMRSDSDQGRYDNMQIRSSANTTVTSKLTLELWVKPLSGGVTTGDVYYHKPTVHKRESSDPWSAYALGTTAASEGRNPLACINTTDGKFWLSGYYYSSEHLIPDGKWTHLAMTYNANATGDNFKLYKNGKLVASTRATGKITSGQGLLMVGYYGNWIVDELRLWKVARTRSQIVNNMTKPLTGTETGLAAYYPFDGTTRDETGHGNDGVLMYRESYTTGKALQ